jgi:hypothetical protein
MPNQFGLPTEDELMKSIYPSENKKITNKRKKLSRVVEKARMNNHLLKRRFGIVD